MDRRNRVFGSETSFDRAYPKLQDAVVEYRRYTHTPETDQGTAFPERHSIRNDGGVIQCTNPACEGGGFEVDALIDDARRSPEGVKEDILSCKGHERMGGGKTRTCCSCIRYKIQTFPKKDDNL